MKYKFKIILNNNFSTLFTKEIEIDIDEDELPDVLSQIADVGFYDVEEQTYYGSNRIYEIKVIKNEK